VQTLCRLARDTGATAVHCSRAYDPAGRQLQRSLTAAFENESIELRRFPGELLAEPEQVATGTGQPYRVFTPFWRRCREHLNPRGPAPAPAQLPPLPEQCSGLAVEELQLLPSAPDWAEHWPTLWQPGEAGAGAALQDFLAQPLADYHEQRDFPAAHATSRLSPHLHFGELSPLQVWLATRHASEERAALETAAAKFLAELGWREFCRHLLFHFPDICDKPFREEFADFPWQRDPELVRAWQCGRTGYPLVDAGMRELWHTGSMHNRVRMVVASFLTKHLRQHWLEGARWFEYTLVDADLASNRCNWQWVAGCGADAAPYFRIFNPISQSEKFDRSGEYIRRWVPELTALPERHLHRPWLAPEKVLEQSGFSPGRDYPLPLVDHAEAREAALAAWDNVRGSGS
jgi:deoxyribodipyrimidine photo-lyase